MWISKKNIVGQAPAEKREYAYEKKTHKEDGTPLILWDGKARTVDEANKICLAYIIEGNERSDDLKSLIIPARAYIRDIYPDEEG
jgi:hypothetical protein